MPRWYDTSEMFIMRLKAYVIKFKPGAGRCGAVPRVTWSHGTASGVKAPSLMQTWSDFEQDVIDAAAHQWIDRLRSRGHTGGRHFKHNAL